jgi:DNA-binding CsgD family transcriptional regulator
VEAPHRPKQQGGVNLLDREAECGRIDELLAGASSGTSGALVLMGEPGIGKTALLDYAVGARGDMRVAVVQGVPTEVGFQFAAAHQLLGGMLDGIGGLPEPQRMAIRSAFGILKNGSADRFLVGLAMLELLSEAGRERGCLCVVDDVDCVDEPSAQVFGLVARRLGGEGIAFLFSVSDPPAELPVFEGLPELAVSGLEREAARALLAGAVIGRLDDNVRDELIVEVSGNPLALLSLAHELTPSQLAGDALLPTPLPLGNRLELLLMSRVESTSAATQLLLLLLAADPAADIALLARAAEELGLDAVGFVEAQEAGLVTVAEPIRFRHALVGAALYRTASIEQRCRVHEALASAIGPEGDVIRRTWHQAAAASGPDDEIAAELDDASELARRNGDHASTVRFLVRAAELTRDKTKREGRLLAAARVDLAEGAPRKASALLTSLPRPLEKAHRAEAQSLSAAVQIMMARSTDTPAVLLEAARSLVRYDLRLARDAHLEALMAAIYAGPLGAPTGIVEAARAAKVLQQPPPAQRTAADPLLDGFASLVLDGHQAAAPVLRRAVEMLRRDQTFRLLLLGCHAAVNLWDEEALFALATRHVELARASGAAGALATALSYRASTCEVFAGRLDEAEVEVEIARELAQSAGNSGVGARLNLVHLRVVCWRGHEAQARILGRAAIADATARGQGIELGFVRSALAVLEVGVGRYDEALLAAQEASEQQEAFYVNAFALPELVEAAARTGAHEVAAEAVQHIAAATRLSGTHWGLGMLARSRALLDQGASAEALYQEAVAHLKKSRARPQYARAKLLYGEWLRRQRRRSDARRQLRSAHDLFSAMGMDGFRGRARRELSAAGERPARRRAKMGELTPHEARIARLVSDGASNAQIASLLFVSPRTIEYHLHKIFRKLDFRSRSELARWVADHGAD